MTAHLTSASHLPLHVVMARAHVAWAKIYQPHVYKEGQRMGMYAGDEGLTQDDADWRPPDDPEFNPEPQGDEYATPVDDAEDDFPGYGHRLDETTGERGAPDG